jgi:hypothetical protein
MPGRDFALPVEQVLRVGHEVLVHLEAHMVDASDLPLVEDAADQPDGRVLDVVVAQGRDPAGGAGGRQHALRIGKPRGHRLLAPHMLAGLQGRNRHLGMEGVGGGDRHHVHGRIRHEGAPVAGGALEAELARFPLRQVLRRLRQHRQTRPRHVAEDGRDRVPGERMALAHIAGADEADSECRHG